LSFPNPIFVIYTDATDFERQLSEAFEAWSRRCREEAGRGGENPEKVP